MTEPVILYEDKYLWLVEKPQGMPSQPDPSGQESLLRWLAAQYSCVRLVHRLDTPTGGIMVYAKSAEATAGLTAVLNHREGEGFEKIYLAVLSKSPNESEGMLEDYLYHDKRSNKSYVVPLAIGETVRKGTKRALLHYRVLQSLDDGRTLVYIRLLTGRTHQIRIQFASRGCPLVGDGKYGSRIKCPYIALWSHRLTFQHPITGRKIEAISVPPKDQMPWTDFQIEYDQ